MKALRVPNDELLSVSASLAAHDRAEMAIPSYTHANPLIRWLFWKRLDTAIQMADLREGQSAFEFGVGSGILLRTLHARASRVGATDLHLAPARAMAERLGTGTEFVELADFAPWVEKNRSKFDCIFALDVLEHVEEDELRTLSKQFLSLLRPGGRLIVSGPTETAMYKVGRFVAGFKGDYHHRTIFDIDKTLREDWKVMSSGFVPNRPLPRAFLLTAYTAP